MKPSSEQWPRRPAEKGGTKSKMATKKHAPLLGEYHAPDGKILYGEQRRFLNKPLWTKDPLGLAGHIFRGQVYEELSDGHQLSEHESIWRPMLDRRMELEVFCRCHNIRVPRARSTELSAQQHVNDETVLMQIQREVMQMERRLHRFHHGNARKKTSHVQERDGCHTNTEEMLLSDPDLSDFTASDDDFQNYVPECLMLNGIPRCCMGYA